MLLIGITSSGKLVFAVLEPIKVSLPGCTATAHSTLLEMSPHVATLRLFPGISTATIKAFLSPPIRGVILETFGAGNAPQRTDLLQVLGEACDRGVVVVAITQCHKGSVSDAYETGRTLLQAGVVPGNDMTPEVPFFTISRCIRMHLPLSSVRSRN